MYREVSVSVGQGQIASNKPAGWMRRIGRAASPWPGSTTQAWAVSGRICPHGQGLASRIIDHVGSEKFKGVMVISLDQSVNALQRNARTHTFLLV